jgi:hypothetical protein
MAALMIKEQKSREGGIIVSDIMHGQLPFTAKKPQACFTVAQAI